MERELSAELASVGLNWRELKKVLPDWADVAFDSASGLLELKTFLARSLGLQLNTQGALRSKELPVARFKTSAATSIDQVQAARSFATAAARLVARAARHPYVELPSEAALLRAEILASSASGWIDLRALLTACWSRGVPVLHMPSLPVTGRKMDGMVTFAAGRPVIIITKKAPHPDWLLFVLAHEIGHIAKGHLPLSEGEAIVDDFVEISASASIDVQEREANAFATNLLAPNGMEVKLGLRLPTAAKLALQAKAYGKEHSISPGYVVLNAVHNSAVNGQKPFALGQAALKHITGQGTAPELCKAMLRDNIDLDLLRSDSAEFLEKIRLI